MSLEQLLGVKIVSASKSSESLFDAPLSASVLTREDIVRSGATSVAEALRMVPGLIVREQTPGNFDVHIRGFDNTPEYSYFPYSTNSITLVMVNGRPVYNYFVGGTFWDALPIDINDVDRIEVVRGPAAALYGPNAVAGVINIITVEPAKAGPYANANLQGGEVGTRIGTAAVGYKADRWSLGLSANAAHRDRFQDTYYEWRSKTWLPYGQVRHVLAGTRFRNAEERYPDPQAAIDKSGVNAFVAFDPRDGVRVALAVGAQDSQAQRVLVDNQATPLTTSTSDTSYADLRYSLFGLSGQVSYNRGDQRVLGVTGWEWDFITLDANLEYERKWNQISLRPGVSYRRAEYDGFFIGGKHSITTQAAFLRADYTPNESLRVVAALRADKYDVPDDTDLSYQLALLRRFGENTLLRGVLSRASRAPFMNDSFMDFHFAPLPVVRYDYYGNKQLDLLSMELLELGLRRRFSRKLALDVEVFRAEVKDYADVVLLDSRVDTGVMVFTSQYRNVEAVAKQNGLTASLSFLPTDAWQLRAFVTVQQTDLEDQRLPAALGGILADVEHKNTPRVFGGLYLNYQRGKLNLNSSAYYLASQTAHQSFGSDDLGSKVLLDLKASYRLVGGLKPYLNVRNLLDEGRREFTRADEIGRTALLGIAYEF